MLRSAVLFAASGLWLSSACLAPAQEPPASGNKVAGAEALDRAAVEFKNLIAAKAVTVAVAKDGQLVYSRGFGWSDQQQKKPVAPDALMRIASVSKPITKILVSNSIRGGQLSPDARAFELIGVKPPGGRLADPRVAEITVQHLLDHKGGWDSKQTFDPMFRMREIQRALGLTRPPSPVNVIEFMLTQPLQTAPGETYAYSNFGYCVLGRVLEKVHKRSYGDVLEQGLCRPLGLKDIKLARNAAANRDPREVSYPIPDGQFSVEVMDAHGGLIASAPALCRVFLAYGIGGEVLKPGQKFNYTFFGSIPGTTSMVRQRTDGFVAAVLLNARREGQFSQDNDALKASIDQAIDTIVARR